MKTQEHCSHVYNSPKFVGGDFSAQRIATVRAALGLGEGEYLKQDNAAEASRLLGRR